MKNNDAAIQWAVDYLESNGCRLVSVQKALAGGVSSAKAILSIRVSYD